jgi:hypothetical protein
MRNDRAGHLVTRQPRRQDRALAHAGPAGHDDPAIGIVCNQQPVELRKHDLAADESFVALPFDAVVEALSEHPVPRHARYQASWDEDYPARGDATPPERPFAGRPTPAIPARSLLQASRDRPADQRRVR